MRTLFKIFLIFFIISIAPAHADINSELIGWWRFDEGSGTTTTDSSGGGHTGTLNNGPLWADRCPRGKCLSFDGGNDTVSVTHDAAFNVATISFGGWFKTSYAAGSRAAFLSKYVGGSGNGWELGVTANKLYCFYFGASSNVGGGIDFLSIASVNNNVWHHGFIVIDAVGGTMYVDGVSVATKAWSAAASATTTNTTVLMGQASGNSYFPGNIDDLRIYNRALTAADVADLYRVGAVVRNAVISNGKINQ